MEAVAGVMTLVMGLFVVVVDMVLMVMMPAAR